MNAIRNSLLFLFLGSLVCAVLVPAMPGTADADVIHLRTGESVKGRPVQGRCDEKVLVIEDYISGATRTILWDVVDPEDRQRLQEDMGFVNKSLKAIEGHRIVIELQDGSKEALRGLIVREDDNTVYLLQGGDELKIQKSMITGRDTEEMDPRDIWSPEQLVERFLKSLADDEGVDLNDLSSRERFRIAEYAESAGDFETAKTHYTACAGDPEFLLANVATQRLERVESILRDAAALADLRAMRMALSLKAFRKVREMLTEFPRKHADAGEAVQNRLERAQKEFTKRRNDYFQMEAKIDFPKLVLNLIKSKVSEDEVGLSDVTAWTRRELPDLAFGELTALFNKKDDVSPEETRAFWENRPKSNWKTATYGAGTFIVEPPKIKPPKRKAPSKNKKSSGGGAAPAIKIPKPPTRDQWWEGAGTAHRQSWIMAFFVENSGLFEVSDKPTYSKCGKCNGEGLESKRFQTGAVLYYLCTRCGGAQRDKRVRFR
jgi:hypothetical protein